MCQLECWDKYNVGIMMQQKETLGGKALGSTPSWHTFVETLTLQLLFL
jgi:hypothetical protein